MVSESLLKYSKMSASGVLKIKNSKELLSEVQLVTSFLEEYSKKYDHDINLRQRLWHIKNNIFTIPLCICGNYKKWSITSESKGYVSCSRNCLIKLSKERQLEKYDNKLYSQTDEFKKRLSEQKADILKKMTETNLRLYSVDNTGKIKKEYIEIPSVDVENDIKTLRQKIVSNRGAYNYVKSIGKLGLIKSLTNFLKEDASFAERWHCFRNSINDYPVCEYCNQQKSYNTHSSSYNATCSDEKCVSRMISINKISKWLPDDYKLIMTPIGNNGFYKLVHTKCDSTFDLSDTYCLKKVKNNIELCPMCDKTGYLEEELLLQHIKQYTTNIKLNSRNIIRPLELDIYLEDYNLAIEVNGLYWHSIRFKDKFYHRDKSDICESKGIKLLHINNYDIQNNINIVKSIISQKLGKVNRLFGRKASKRILTTEEEKIFLKENHLQGYSPSTIAYGLFIEEELVQMMSFTYWKESNKWEIERLATKINTLVIGGTERLWKEFVIMNKPKEVFTYCDRDYFSGDSYKKLGFHLDSIITDSYFYTNGRDKKSRQSLQKHKLMLNIGEDTEEHRNRLGYYRYYGSGTYKYTINI